MQSSAGELEYCSYIIHKKASENSVVHFAWSEKGQKYYSEAIPDLVLNNEIYFWNGCLVHGHKPSECLFNRKRKSTVNMFGETLVNAFSSYSSKKARLALKHPELQINEMWHCQWNKLKNTNDDVKNFLQTTYRFPPTYRLNARAAGDNFGLSLSVRKT